MSSYKTLIKTVKINKSKRLIFLTAMSSFESIFQKIYNKNVLKLLKHSLYRSTVYTPKAMGNLIVNHKTYVEKIHPIEWKSSFYRMNAFYFS
jgi:predicted RNA-binding protein (virulence factor B family)